MISAIGVVPNEGLSSCVGDHGGGERTVPPMYIFTILARALAMRTEAKNFAHIVYRHKMS